MPEIVNMEETLKKFSHAVEHGLPIHPCLTDKTIFAHRDAPNGVVRYTFCKIENEKITSMVALCEMDPHEGLPLFNIGYATAISQRKKGLAKALLKAAIYEMREMLKRIGINDFYIEAGIEKNNVASQKVASGVFKIAPFESYDPDSGTPTLAYLCKASSL